jgi:hypothetical protein
LLYAEHAGDKLRLVSRAESSTETHEVEHRRDRRANIRVKYLPESRTVVISLDGQDVLVHEIGILVTAPSDVTIGENRVDSAVTHARFTGRLDNIVKTVTASGRGDL